MPVEHAVPGTILDLKSEPLGRVVIEGEGVTLRIGLDSLVHCDIWVRAEASNTVIEIGEQCILNGLIQVVAGDGGVIRIGDFTTFNAVGLSQHEAGEMIFGRNNMLSTDIHIDVSDMHGIYDRATGARLNPPLSVVLGDNVWVGTRAMLLKGCRIGSGTVIGAGAVVSGEIPANVIAVGTPARVVRENITWLRTTPDSVEPDPSFGPPPAKRRGIVGRLMDWIAGSTPQ
ncbi:acyltransferase [Phenylobacterium sp.]|uniref:acyltransferase n=1 Tax=Phenylobacterium sp. TaxID=1871053 RepID=UPI003983378D